MGTLQPAPRHERRTPAQAWAEIVAGNRRFQLGQSAHPHQSIQSRERVAEGQHPFAALFGCADSRVAAEIVVDQGLGDVFVVRTAGHVVDPSVLGSLEFGVAVLDIPLIVVLSHTACGAIAATLSAVESGDIPGGFLRDLVERVSPSILTARRAGLTGRDAIGQEHLRHTTQLIAERSALIARRITDGSLAVVGAQYDLTTGATDLITVIGDIGDAGPAAP